MTRRTPAAFLVCRSVSQINCIARLAVTRFATNICCFMLLNLFPIASVERTDRGGSIMTADTGRWNIIRSTVRQGRGSRRMFPNFGCEKRLWSDTRTRRDRGTRPGGQAGHGPVSLGPYSGSDHRAFALVCCWEGSGLDRWSPVFI